MKRFLSVVMVLLMMFVMTSCFPLIKKGVNQERAGSVLPAEQLFDMGERTIDLSEGISENRDSFYYSCDLDYDGKEEAIAMKLVNIEDYKQILEIKAGDKMTEYEIFEGFIEKVYSCDIRKDDGARDIAIVTSEGSDDPRIKILSFAATLSPYEFVSDYEDDKAADSLWLGYACSYYFNVNNDDTITLETQTNSYGMWSVMRNYKLNGNVFEEIVQDKYAILPDFMERGDYLDEILTAKEKGKWEKGYIKANELYFNESITIAEGEYFKPLYDNDRGLVYIEKENGETGYIDVNDSYFAGYNLNDMYFYLAG